MDLYKIFQVYYDEKQRETLYDSVRIEPTFNPVPSAYSFRDAYYILENKVILDKITPEVDAEYVGVWSHKHYDKIWNFSQDERYVKAKEGRKGFVKWLDETVSKRDFDILGFHRHLNKYHKKHMLTMAERFHPRFNKLLKHLVNKAGVAKHVNLNPDFPFVTLMNYQLAKKDIYLDYIENVLKPVVDAMLDESDKNLQHWLFSDAGYNGDAKMEGTLMKIGGKPYYTMHTFILERLFTLYLNTKNYKCISY